MATKISISLPDIAMERIPENLPNKSEFIARHFLYGLDFASGELKDFHKKYITLLEDSKYKQQVINNLKAEIGRKDSLIEDLKNKNTKQIKLIDSEISSSALNWIKTEGARRLKPGVNPLNGESLGKPVKNVWTFFNNNFEQMSFQKFKSILEENQIDYRE